jgi:hypothetical protein
MELVTTSALIMGIGSLLSSALQAWAARKGEAMLPPQRPQPTASPTPTSTSFAAADVAQVPAGIPQANASTTADRMPPAATLTKSADLANPAPSSYQASLTDATKTGQQPAKAPKAEEPGAGMSAADVLGALGSGAEAAAALRGARPQAPAPGGRPAAQMGAVQPTSMQFAVPAARQQTVPMTLADVLRSSYRR